MMKFNIYGLSGTVECHSYVIDNVPLDSVPIVVRALLVSGDEITSIINVEDD